MGQLDVGDWILMVSMYLVLLPGLLAVFYALWKYGPEVRKEALLREGVKSD